MKDGIDAGTREDQKAKDIARVVYLMATMSAEGVQRLRMFADGVDSAERPMVPSPPVVVQPRMRTGSQP